MAWNDTAVKVAVKAITDVESDGDYTAINYRDPITVGIAQWYGTRAAAILNRMKGEAVVWGSGPIASIANDLAKRPASSSWWTSRYLSKAEGESLKPILARGAGIQVQQMSDDINGDYLRAARSIGMNPDTNTDAVIFFMVMYHQTPARARKVVNSAGASSSLNRLLSFALNEPVFGKYKTRYNKAADIIRRKDTSGVVAAGNGAGSSVSVPETLPGGDGGVQDEAESPEASDGSQPLTDLSYALVRNGTIYMHMKDGTQYPLYGNGSGTFTAQLEAPAGGVPRVDDGTGTSAPLAPAPPSEQPQLDPRTPAPATKNDELRAKVVKWMTDRKGKFTYRQAPGRENPDKSGFGDCSSTVRRAYLDVMGIDVGSYTGAQWSRGRVVLSGAGQGDRSKLLPGDLFLINWRGYRSVVDHVEMIVDGPGNVCIGHGGPGRGPVYAKISSIMGKAQNWRIVRHIG